MEELSKETIRNINRRLAQEFIASRLDAELSINNINKLARCIEDLENSKKGNKNEWR